MSFAPPVMVREIARRSRRIQSLPVATQRQIHKSCEAGAMTTTLAAPADTGAGPDIAAGSYVVSDTPVYGGTFIHAGAPLRSSPTTSATTIDTIPEGQAVDASGDNQNFFAKVTTQGKTGWISVMYLQPAQPAATSGALPLSATDTLQLRTILAAWSHATPGAPVYGVLATDFDQTPAADGRQAIVVQAFQQQRGGLRTDGVLDAPTRGAILSWARDALTPGAVPGPGGPTQGPLGPLPNQPPAIQNPTPAASSPGSSVLPLVALGAALLYLLIQEEKKKRRKAA